MHELSPQQWDVIESVEGTIGQLSVRSGNEFAAVAASLDDNSFAEVPENRDRMVQGWLKAVAEKAFPDNQRAQARYRGMLTEQFGEYVQTRGEIHTMMDSILDFSLEHFNANPELADFLSFLDNVDIDAAMNEEPNTTNLRKKINEKLEERRRIRAEEQTAIDAEILRNAKPADDSLQEVLNTPPNLAEEQDLELVARYLYTLYTRRPLVEFADAMKQLRAIKSTRAGDVEQIDTLLMDMLTADREMNIDRVAHIDAMADDPKNIESNPDMARALKLKMETLRLKVDVNKLTQQQDILEVWGSIGRLNAITKPESLTEQTRQAA
jgi:hypothetical protein